VKVSIPNLMTDIIVVCCTLHVCGRNLITGLTSAASPSVDISSTCNVGQKLGVSLPLLTCSLSAWPSRLLYRRGRKSRRTYELPCIPARRAATRRRLKPKSRNTRIGATEIAGLDVQISMSGHPVQQMWHPFNSTHGGTRSRPVADTTGNVTVHHGRCCSHMEQPRNHTEDNTCRFKMSLFVHNQCRRSLRTANSRSTHVMSLFMYAIT